MSILTRSYFPVVKRNFRFEIFYFLNKISPYLINDVFLFAITDFFSILHIFISLILINITVFRHIQIDHILLKCTHFF